MASYNFVLAAVIALAISSCNCRADLIDNVCGPPSDDNNYSLCIVTLRLDPRATPPLTYRLLAEIAVDGAINQSKWAADKAREFEKENKKVPVETCADSLYIAHAKIVNVKGLLKKVKDAKIRKRVDMLVSLAESYMCVSQTVYNITRPPVLELYYGNFMSLANLIHKLIYKIPIN